MDRLTEFLFKYGWPVFARGELGFANRPTWWMAVVLFIGLGALAYFFYASLGDRIGGRLRVGLMVLRGALLLVILLLIMRPVVVVPSVIPRSASLAILVDNSRSMGLKDEGGRTRIEAVRDLLTGKPDLANRLARNFRLRPYQFAGELSPLPVTAAGLTVSDLTAGGLVSDPGGAMATLRQDSDSSELAAVLLISDGAANRSRASGDDIGDQLRSLRSQGVPVFTIGVGDRDGFQDLELARINLPRRLLIGSAVTADLFIRRSGGLDVESLTVRISEDGRLLKSQNLDGRQLGTGGDPKPLTVEFSPGSPGTHRYSFELAPVDGETTIENNSIESLVEVSDGNPRILHLEGEPRWEYGKLRFSLAKNEKNLVLVSVLRSADGKFYRQGVGSGNELVTGFPASTEELFEYDGIVLGSIEANFFSYEQLQLIEQFASRRGGGVLALGGGRALGAGRYGGTPVAGMLPVEIDPPGSGAVEGAGSLVAGFSPRLTARGRTHPITRLNEDRALSARAWEEMPPVTIPERLTRLKPGASVILEAVAVDSAGAGGGARGDMAVPMLIEQRYGRGRSLALLASDTWRWRMELPSQNSSHETFWRQLLRYLVSTTPRRFEVASERDTYVAGDGMTVTAELNDPRFEPVSEARVVATVTLPSGREIELPLEPSYEEKVVTYRGNLTVTETGVHKISATARRGGVMAGEATSSFLVTAQNREFFDAGQNETLLKRIAAETGGRYYPMAEAEKVTDEITLLEGRHSERVSRDLWDMPINFLLLIGLVAGEWFLRKREGLA